MTLPDSFVRKGRKERKESEKTVCVAEGHGYPPGDPALLSFASFASFADKIFFLSGSFGTPH